MKNRLKRMSRRIAASALLAAIAAAPFTAAARPAPASDAGKSHRISSPYLSWQTKFLDRKIANIGQLSPVCDGIFSLMGKSSKGGYKQYYGFYTIDGKCLFPHQYTKMSGYESTPPMFDSGACVMQEWDDRPNTPVILYADGTVKQLSKDWTEITPFHQGVAMVAESLTGKTNYFYINTKGEKIWPQLTEVVTTDDMIRSRKVGKVYMRDLREGRRAYFDRTARAWGFLDEKGNIVVKAIYKDVRDYAGGYALVSTKSDNYKYKNLFIDKAGNVAVELPTTMADVADRKRSWQVKDVSDGIYGVSDNDRTITYYDIKSGKELHRYPDGSGFHEGRALVRFGKYSDDIFVVNTDFRPVNVLTTDNRFSIDLSQTDFREFPWCTFDQRGAVNYDGVIEMMAYDGGHRRGYLGQYSAEGFAPVCVYFKRPGTTDDYIDYSGYIDTDGMFRVAFSAEEGAGGPFDGELPGPQPIEPIEPSDSLPRVGPPRLPPLPPGDRRLPRIDTVAAGPIGPGREALKYRVNVVAIPAEGGKVYGSGEYSLGDTIRVTGVPSKGYYIAEVACDRFGTGTETFNKFVVSGDMEIRCYFNKEDDVKEIGDNVLVSPTNSVMGIAKAYAELGKEAAGKFEVPSEGLMAVVANDDGPVITAEMQNNNKTASSEARMFFVPMNVLGVIEENGKQYLRFDGGVVKYTLEVTDDSALGFFMTPIFRLMTAFDGADQGELDPGAYRVEIVAGGPEKDSMTLGKLQRLSTRYGWISADDPFFAKRLPGLFTQRCEKGLNAAMFEGAVLKKSKKMDVAYEPTEEFFGNRTLFQEFSAALGKLYRKAVKGTMLEDYDMQQFSTDLDNNLFKPGKVGK